MSVPFPRSGPRRAGGEAVLPPDEARHLTRVLRLGLDDEVAIFDGRGHEWDGTAYVGAGSVCGRPADEPVRVTAVGILKGDKMDDVVRDATMMGVAAIAPVVSARTIARRQRRRPMGARRALVGQAVPPRRRAGHCARQAAV